MATIFLTIGKSRAIPVESLEAASKAYRAKAISSSRTPEGVIHHADGNFIGRVSFNGKVWAQRQWTPGDTPIWPAK